MAKKNQYFEARVAVCDIPYTNQAAQTTLGGGVYLPTGAVVTGLSLMQTGSASTIASIGAVTIGVGAITLGSLAGSAAPAQTLMSRPALATTQGMYLSTGGEIKMTVGSWLTSNGTPGGFTPTVYVGYLA
jgi:hypothetical protein